MSVILEVTEGWTAELGPFTLYQAPDVVQDLTSITVEIELTDGSGTLMTPAGTVRVATPTTAGKVYFKPAAGDFVAGRLRYTIRWKLTDAPGNVIYIPNGEADEIAVYKK